MYTSELTYSYTQHTDTQSRYQANEFRMKVLRMKEKKAAATTTKYRNYECASIWPISLDHNVNHHGTRTHTSIGISTVKCSVWRASNHTHKQTKAHLQHNQFLFYFSFFYYNKTKFIIHSRRSADFHFDFWCARCTSNLSYVAVSQWRTFFRFIA